MQENKGNEKPTVLCLELTGEQKNTVAALCVKLGLRPVPVTVGDYAEPVGALAGKYEKIGNVYEGTPIPEPMLVFAFVPDPTLQRFLGGLRESGIRRPSLLACMTETNADWTVDQLYRELSRERDAIYAKKRQHEAKGNH
ncbi:MAG: DUF3783 domain-containing protein [Candidatus Methanomethylophilaceae archaeon]|nr:DUF3783 domain-containing protein [Candidatus Methanomethylophilaceae archaeon]